MDANLPEHTGQQAPGGYDGLRQFGTAQTFLSHCTDPALHTQSSQGSYRLGNISPSSNLIPLYIQTER